MKKVITYGTYDLFHQGHYNLLKRAKQLGDYLIVGVTTEHFDESRGKVNVIDPIMDRIENVKKTGFADMIIVEDHDGQKIEDIQKYGVDIFTLGSDWEGAFDYLKAYCDVVYLDRTPNVSSTMLRSNKFDIVRVGIVGTGRIAPRFIAESKYVSGLSIECAYNPDKKSAEKFQKKHEIKVFTDDYDEFLKYVDAVYIASPNETHYMYAKKAIYNKKHVLSEKPLAFTKIESVELYERASKKGVVLMEAIKAAYCPGFQQLINVAKSGKIGEICDIEACFTRLADPDSREMTDEMYGGAFLEFGPSTLLPVIKLLGTDYIDMCIDSITDEKGLDIYTKVNIKYQRSFATIKTGVGVKTEGQLVVSGTKGYIVAPSPWWLMRQFDVRYEDANKVEHYEPTFQGDGLRYEIGDFISKINGTDKKDYKLTAQESIAMSDFIEKFMAKRRDTK
ncbi:MAG: Gfo/Idh/MocA family oxidoreductase [Lachnospira sp.]|jgi:glycerol-3-phosphate cytidylyltransferase|nr:Gfo/Idh/MocA family oxidoreductase [Lachnospira sp.]